jgi:hypothetical protein
MSNNYRWQYNGFEAWAYGYLRFSATQKTLHFWSSSNLTHWPYITNSQPLQKLIKTIFKVEDIDTVV